MEVRCWGDTCYRYVYRLTVDPIRQLRIQTVIGVSQMRAKRRLLKAWKPLMTEQAYVGSTDGREVCIDVPPLASERSSS
jgi:hypothetical protein